MIKSMTGFGRCEYQQGERKFTVEIKAVNHRYFDVNIRIPKKFGLFESSVRSTLKKYIERGKVDVFITYEDLTDANVSIRYNETVAAEYVNFYRRMAETFGLADDVTVSVLGRCPEVFTLEEQVMDEEVVWSTLEQAVAGACRQLVEARSAEGEALKADLLEKLSKMREEVCLIEERSPQILEEYRAKLTEKVNELLGEVPMDEARVATEVIVYADRICTDEETVRLRSHIEAMEASLREGGSVGRRLDFIAQEMNREANTILSKANDLETSNIAIDLKTGIEKVREQIQNIE